MSDITTCCDEPSLNLKERIHRNSSNREIKFIDTIRNPIPDEIRDSKDLKKFFQDWNLVPYAGSTIESGQSLLAWYLMLAKLSSTHNASVQKMIKYAFGGKAMFVKLLDPEFSVQDEVAELNVNEQTVYRDAINEFFTFQDGIGKFHRAVAKSYKDTGNAFVELTFSETLGVGRIFVRAHRITHVLYVNTLPGEPKEVAISPVWTDEYLKKYPARKVAVSTKYASVFTKTKEGLKTVFHLKNGDNTWYGRPDSEGSDLYKMREVQDAIYQIKQANANFTGQIIIEVEDDDPEFSAAVEDEKSQTVGFNSFAERMEHNYTQKANEPQSIMVTARPYGSKPMFVHQLSPNTNENWYKVTGEISEKKIVMAHGITLRFMGFDVSNGLGGGDMLLADYVLNNEPAINDLRTEVIMFTSEIMNAGWDLVGREEWKKNSVTFVTPIQSQIDAFKNADNAVRSTKIQPGG